MSEDKADQADKGVLIECLIRRKDGSRTTFPGEDGQPKVEYHFKPDEEHGEAHVCMVHDPAHVGRFLSITEGYRVYDGRPLPVKRPANENPRQTDDIDAWSNERLIRYAEQRRIVWRNKAIINQYCLEHFDCGLNDRTQAIEMVRQLAKIERAFKVRKAQEDAKAQVQPLPIIDMDDPLQKERAEPAPLVKQEGVELPRLPPGNLGELADDALLVWGRKELELNENQFGDIKDFKAAIHEKADMIFGQSIDSRLRPAEMLRRLAQMISNAHGSKG